MQLIAGVPLNDYLQNLDNHNQRLRPKTTVRLIISLAAELDYAHERGMVPRDVKPGNVILRYDQGDNQYCTQRRGY